MNTPQKKYSVLIVEDDPGYRVLMQNAIAEINKFVNVDLVYTGEQVMDLLLKENTLRELNRQLMPDLILANVKMNYFDLNAVEEIRTHDQFKHIPIYLLSMLNSSLIKERALELGAAGYYEKPDSFLDLKSVLHSIFKKYIA